MAVVKRNLHNVGWRLTRNLGATLVDCGSKVKGCLALFNFDQEIRDNGSCQGREQSKELSGEFYYF
eukprot:801357-Rhodomonas_salina.1